MNQIVWAYGKNVLNTKEPPLKSSGDVYQWDYREDDNDYYTQPGMLFRLMTPEQQHILFNNTAAEMDGC